MNRNDQEKGNSNIPENDPSKGMNSKKEVDKSPDPKTDQDFPGYPHYPAKEDIMDQRTDIHKVDVDVQNDESGPNASGLNQRFVKNQNKNETGSEGDAENKGDESDALNARNEEIGAPHNVTNDDLDEKENTGTDMKDAAKT